MSDALTINEFPFVAELPKREKSRFQRVMDEFERFGEVQKQKGLLVPAHFASRILDVCKQRVTQLMDEGKLERIDFNGHPFITRNSIINYLKNNKGKVGRPRKVGIVAQLKQAVGDGVVLGVEMAEGVLPDEIKR